MALQYVIDQDDNQVEGVSKNEDHQLMWEEVNPSLTHPTNSGILMMMVDFR